MIRAATSADLPRIRELHQQLENQAAQKFDLPDIGDAALLGFWVVEKDGEIINGFYIEKLLEFCMIGSDPEGTAEIIKFQAERLAEAQKIGARYVHCNVPPDMEEAIYPHLEKNQFEATGLVHHQARLR